MVAVVTFLIGFMVGITGCGLLCVAACVQLMTVSATRKAKARIERQTYEAEQRLAHISRQAQAQLIAVLSRQMRARHSANQDGSYI